MKLKSYFKPSFPEHANQVNVLLFLNILVSSITSLSFGCIKYYYCSFRILVRCITVKNQGKVGRLLLGPLQQYECIIVNSEYIVSSQPISGMRFFVSLCSWSSRDVVALKSCYRSKQVCRDMST